MIPGTRLAAYPALYQFRTEDNYMVEGENAAGVASNFIWALAFIIIVALIVGAFYYGGFLSGNRKTDVDVEITAPSR